MPHLRKPGTTGNQNTPDGIAIPVGYSLKLYTFVKDHLGCVRSVVDVANAAKEIYQDYPEILDRSNTTT